jgi:HEAT repeat protein
MNRPNETEELVAMQALGFAREARAFVALTERYRFHASEGHRLGAAGALDALAHLARPESAPLFEALLTDGTPLERRLAIEGLARLGDPARLPAMQAASAGARDGQVRLALLFARARLLGDGSAPGIRAALGDRRLGDQAAGYLRELGLAP